MERYVGEPLLAQGKLVAVDVICEGVRLAMDYESEDIVGVAEIVASRLIEEQAQIAHVMPLKEGKRPRHVETLPYGKADCFIPQNRVLQHGGLCSHDQSTLPLSPQVKNG